MLTEHDQNIVDQLVEGFLQWGRAKDQANAKNMKDVLYKVRDLAASADDVGGVMAELAKRKYDPVLRARRIADMDAASVAAKRRSN